ncbi:hypothetical protein OIU78_023105 [Salix suchowensis]|nr:hypothetical protein OIU78_023105 [Salix suchowensis]
MTCEVQLNTLLSEMSWLDYTLQASLCCF